MLAALPLAGCAATQPPPAAAVGSSEALPTGHIAGPGPFEKVYARYAIGTDERIGTRRLVASGVAGGEWTVEAVDRDTEGNIVDGPRTTRHRRAEDGGVLMLSVLSPRGTDPDDPMRLFTFEPPLVLFPERLSPGEPFESTAEMLERPPGGGEPSGQRGEARREVYLTEIPAGLDDLLDADAGEGAIAVTEIYDFGLGGREARSVLVISSEVGIVAERLEATTKVFGIPTDQDSERRVLTRERPSESASRSGPSS